MTIKFLLLIVCVCLIAVPYAGQYELNVAIVDTTQSNKAAIALASNVTSPAPYWYELCVCVCACVCGCVCCVCVYP